MLAVIDDQRRFFEEIRIVREDNRELRTTVDVQTVRIHELETDVLEERKKAETLHEQLQETKHRLARAVYEIRKRTERMTAEGVTLVKQVVDDKILDEGHEVKTPSAENENDLIEVAETSASANH